MGKRKKAAKKPGGGRKNEPLPTTFPCLFCNHEKSVSVKIDKKSGVGQLNCKVCNQAYQTSVNYLSAAVDVYSDWVDACDTVAKEDAPGESRAAARPHQPAGQRPNQAARARSEDDLEDLIDDEGVEDDEFPDFAGGGGGYRGEGVGGDDEY